MPSYTDSLRGYAFRTHHRDGFKCCYCGLDGSTSFENWLRLSQEHLLPKGHPERDNPVYISTACMFCNIADNRYFDNLAARGLTLEGLTPLQLIEQRRPYVLKTRTEYRAFWEKYVFTPRDRRHA